MSKYVKLPRDLIVDLLVELSITVDRAEDEINQRGHAMSPAVLESNTGRLRELKRIAADINKHVWTEPKRAC
jgi:hypothetical protein